MSGRFSVSAVGIYQLANFEAAVSKRVGSSVLGAYRLGVLSIIVRRWDDSTQSHGAAGFVSLSLFFCMSLHTTPWADEGLIFLDVLVSSLDLLRDAVFLILDTPLSRAVKYLRIRNALTPLHWTLYMHCNNSRTKRSCRSFGSMQIVFTGELIAIRRLGRSGDTQGLDFFMNRILLM